MFCVERSDAPRARRRGQRPLLLALLRNDAADVAEVLLAAGADPRAEDAHGLTCLHWLAQRRDDAAVLAPLAALLARCGADLEARERLYGARRAAQAAPSARPPQQGPERSVLLAPQARRRWRGPAGTAAPAPRRRCWRRALTWRARMRSLARRTTGP